MKMTSRFKALILDREILRMPCVHNGLAARCARKAGARAVCCGGYGASASLLGMPDVGLLTMTEMAGHVGRMAGCLDIPVFADADTGHGGLPNVTRTVKAFEQAGAAGLFIEDQVFPKRCGHMDGKAVVSREEMAAKITAALDARTDPDFVIMGRTDALSVHGLDEAIARGQLMRRAGADVIFVEAPRTVEDMRRIVAEIDAPVMANFIEGGKTPLLDAQALQELGFSLVSYGVSALYAAAWAMEAVFREIMETGGSAGMAERMLDFGAFNELMGLSAIREREAACAGAAKRLMDGSGDA